jgi:DnaJ-class molecular chaperone
LDKARRRLAAELHPDRWSDKLDARQAREEMMKNINAAYERLRHLAR